jgi:hypothetical protein
MRLKKKLLCTAVRWRHKRIDGFTAALNVFIATAANSTAALANSSDHAGFIVESPHSDSSRTRL